MLTFLFARKLALKGLNGVINNFDEVNFFRRVAFRSPEIHIFEVALCVVQFDALHKEKIFPKSPSIISCVKWGKVVD